MRQVLVVIDETDVNTKTLDFACFIAKLTKSDLVPILMRKKGEFREEKTPAEIPAFAIDGDTLNQFERREETSLESRRLASEACSNRGVNLYFVQEDSYDFDELVKESRYSDLIIVDGNISFEKRFEGTPTLFLRRLLEKTECPVIVAPDSFEALDEIIFAYDGGQSAMFAIRQFTYLFPELTSHKLTVIQVCDESDQIFTEKERLAQWLSKYYNNVDYRLFYGSPKDELFGYLLGKERKLLIMGAFGRTMLSSLVSKSNAELILKAINLPVFISHT